MKRLAWMAACTILIVACGADDWRPEDLKTGRQTRSSRTLAKGRDSYQLYCSGCHGATGDGVGPAARFLEPKPRDLRKARIKFGSVAAGNIPRDEDLDRILVHGLTGTAMPSWQLIPANERAAIIAYMKTFSENWNKKAQGAPVPFGQDPYRKDPAKAIALGEKLYHQRQCWTCHPAYVDEKKLIEYTGSPDTRPDLALSVIKDSEWGAPILPPDFRQDRVKSIAGLPDLARVIAAGVGGTAMPSWGTTLPPEEIWAIAYYVDSLMKAGAKQP